MAWEQLSMNRLEIPLKEVYSFMGYKDSEPDTETSRVTEYLLSESAQFLRPQFKYIMLEGSLSNDMMQLTLQGPAGPVTFDSGKIICRQLRGAQKYVVFVATVGTGYFQWTDAVKRRDDMFQTYVMDCVGSQIVESVADYMETVLQKEIDPSGFKRTNRFSPGYCGWHVSEQPKLFSLFSEPKPCGIELTDSCLMLPVKSVSGIIGIGPDVRYLPYTCGICDKKDCYKRRG